ncbi:30S ribosomal protein S7 [Candidatus Woesearchaeota archaeon]|nr:30S ribosomal protein S7 [Candidatus Woesearchaeota archaeon]
MNELKIFDRWDTNQIKVTDLGLQDYINLKQIVVPRTCGRNIGTQFWKSKTNIVERLINKLMIPGHKGKKHKISSGRCGGKAITTYLIVEKTFLIIERKTNKNPIEVFVKALENAAPREEITTIEYGGARYPKAVECAPQRRIDMALKLMVQGSYANSYGKKKSIEDALAEEIIKAYNMDQTSNAIGKKLEIERQSDASR